MRQAGGFSSQRGRAIAVAKKKAAERRRSERRSLHINRVFAEIRVRRNFEQDQNEEPSSIMVLLNDISHSGVSFFCSAPLMPGEIVEITMERPMRFYVKGRVVWSEKFNTESHIISANEHPYRAGVEFQYQADHEKNAVKAFFDSLNAASRTI
ncbi:PilZ domain-containing protein [bacterium]|jgi:hypothetical protein|nr:PilZ domain-containing protein [bacterium]